jgi:hypothetical protein
MFGLGTFYAQVLHEKGYLFSYPLILYLKYQVGYPKSVFEKGVHEQTTH